MCLIAYQPAGDSPFTREILENGWDANHHGAGFMFAVNGKLEIRKPFRKLKDLMSEYYTEHAKHGATSAFCIHFRWATHGSGAEHNIHPHVLANGEAALVHNGVLGEFEPPIKSDLSDTAWFCRTVLANRPATQLTSEAYGCVLAEMIGAHNKFVIFAADGSCVIVNHDKGIYDGLRWYSNSAFKECRDRNFSGYTGTGKGIVERGFTLPPGDGLPPAGGKKKRKRKQREADDRALPSHFRERGDGSFDPWGGIVGEELWNDTPEEDRQELEDLYYQSLDHLHTEAVKLAPGLRIDWDALDDAAWKLAKQSLDATHGDDLDPEIWDDIDAMSMADRDESDMEADAATSLEMARASAAGD